MGHAALDNRTPYACEHLFLRDEEGRLVFVVLVQATFAIVNGAGLVLAEEQEPPSLAGRLWGTDAADSSYRIEPVFAFTKTATDVVLVGHAQSGGRPVSELHVRFRVGPVGKVIRAVGDRTWVRSGGIVASTRPEPFERLPLRYERAFGGWDRSHPDPGRHTFDPRNPVGVGFRAPDSGFEDGLRLPNLEDPDDPLLRWGQTVVPAGVGFTSPDWQPRAALAGTYDAAWAEERCPLLAKDFDRRFFNAASAGLVAPGYLIGDEEVLVENASPRGRLSFRLPGAARPICGVELTGRRDARPALCLDTVVVDADADRVHLLYRGHVSLRDDPHDVVSIVLDDETQAAA